jgi:hypothetical protein
MKMQCNKIIKASVSVINLAFGSTDIINIYLNLYNSGNHKNLIQCLSFARAEKLEFAQHYSLVQ